MRPVRRDKFGQKILATKNLCGMFGNRTYGYFWKFVLIVKCLGE